MALPVPVTLGSGRHHELAIEGGSVLHAWFPAGTVIARHTHDHPIVAIMLAGAFDLRICGRGLSCAAATVMIEPAGEPHGNAVHHDGAEVLVLQPDPARSARWHPFAPLLTTVGFLVHPGVRRLGLRVAGEIRSADALSGLAADALSLEMLIAIARMNAPARADRASPPWWRRIEELLRELPVGSLRVNAIADAVGMEPHRLVRMFRRRHQMGLGAYVRLLRLERSASRLASSNDSISRIAAEEGFADQSHLTRLFKAHFGFAPAAYRSRHRKLSSADPESAQL
jgi:AraC-like DNA-binding protein